jgi:hypothetical protein
LSAAAGASSAARAIAPPKLEFIILCIFFIGSLRYIALLRNGS